MWAKFLYALTVTATAALAVTILAIRALDLPFALAVIQAYSTLATCAGLCGLAVGLGARLPSYRESNSGRIASSGTTSSGGRSSIETVPRRISRARTALSLWLR